MKRATSKAGQVRIIGGKWKRTPLPVPNLPGLRPTPDRVRETVFNWLDHLLGHNWQGLQCLDLFAGSGALGFEAASRGAAKVLMFEQQTAAYEALRGVQSKLSASEIILQKGDAVDLIQRVQTSFDVIFIDPPFASDLLPHVLILALARIKSSGYLYLETGTSLAQDLFDTHQLTVLRQLKAGAVQAYLLQRSIVSNSD